MKNKSSKMFYGLQEDSLTDLAKKLITKIVFIIGATKIIFLSSVLPSLMVESEMSYSQIHLRMISSLMSFKTLRNSLKWL